MGAKKRGNFNRIKSLFRNKTPWQVFTRLIALVVAAGAAAVSLLVFLVWAGFFGRMPGKKELQNIQHPIASEVYSADSVLLGRYFIQERSYANPNELPETLKKTLIATEDVRFYDHHGIDIRSLGRVAVKSILLQKESSGGGSTITQQLAKNLFPRKDFLVLSLPINKIREYIIAWRIENLYTKDEILAIYLNTIPFADNTYGIKTAADRFFSVPVQKLSWGQSAVLIGMLKATHTYNPRLFPERSLKRRNVVLAQVAKYEMISEEQKRKIQEQELGLKYNHTTHNAGLAPYFRAYIQAQLLTWCKEHEKENGEPYNLYTDGLKIYTTIDSRIQRYAEDAMKAHMASLQKKLSNQLTSKQLDEITRGRIKSLSQYKVLKEEGLSESEILRRLKKKHDTKIFTWEGEKKKSISIYDSVKHHMQFLQAGILAQNPNSGEILAWVGGIDHQYFKYDHVKESTKRQVGSTFKPIVYAAALEEGISPCNYISAQKTSYTNMDEWTPENTQEETYEKKYSMQGGLSQSVNTVSVKLIEKTGIRDAIKVARRMGITSELPAVPSLALGTPSISVMEMVSAYSTFANGGEVVVPKFIRAIKDRSGKVIERFDEENEKDKKKEKAISDETAAMMVHMLKGVVTSGTAASLKSVYGLPNDIAGKTGTTQSNVDGWFIALTPNVVIGAWVGADDPRIHFKSTAQGQGSATALPIVGKFFQLANKDKALRPMLLERFDPLSDRLQNKLDCDASKSNLNFFEKIFKKKKKKKVKVTRFKGKVKDREPS